MSDEIFINCKYFHSKEFPQCKTHTIIKDGNVISVGKCEESGSNGICFQKFRLPHGFDLIFGEG